MNEFGNKVETIAQDIVINDFWWVILDEIQAHVENTNLFHDFIDVLFLLAKIAQYVEACFANVNRLVRDTGFERMHPLFPNDDILSFMVVNTSLSVLAHFEETF